MKEEFLNLLRSIQREGMEDLIKFIESTDFLRHQLVLDFTEILNVVYCNIV